MKIPANLETLLEAALDRKSEVLPPAPKVMIEGGIIQTNAEGLSREATPRDTHAYFTKRFSQFKSA